ncbi:Transcriptional regulator HosA [compost metagenome]
MDHTPIDKNESDKIKKPRGTRSRHPVPDAYTGTNRAVHQSELSTSKSSTPQLFDERNRSVAWLIRSVFRLYTAQLQHLVTREGVTIGHWYYLRVLAEQDGLVQRELSKRVGIAATTAVPALDDMEKHGLVLRQRDPKDRRRICVFLTVKGRRLIDEMLPSVIALLEQSISGVSSKDMKTFFEVLSLITENLKEYSSDVVVDID